MKKLTLLLSVMALAIGSLAQPVLVHHNKPLAYINPAWQNLKYDKAYLSISGRNAPFSGIDAEITDYFAIGEMGFRDGGIRVGAYSGNILSNNRRFSYNKAYANIGVIPEETSRITFGIDAGVYRDAVVPDYLDSLDKPIDFIYQETEVTQFTLGAGINFEFEQFKMGVGVQNLNRPSLIENPELDGRYFLDDQGEIIDTFHNVGLVIYDLNFTFNFQYHWETAKGVKVAHNLIINQPNNEGATYASFQNVIQGKRWEASFGGVYQRQVPYYNAMVGLNIDKSVWFSLGAFISEYQSFDKSTRTFIDYGYQPLFEANLQLRL
jgi:hypothetical protein